MLNDEKAKIAIIGNGCAAAECLKAVRENGYGGEVHILAENRLPISNPMLTTYYVADKISYDNLFPYGNNNKIYEDYQATVHPGSPVVALDAEEKTVRNKDGLALKFDQCLIASGAAPILLPVPGINSERVYTMRTVEDALRLKKVLAQKPRKALVYGTSMVAIKIVEVFHNAGLEVCMCGRSNQIFRRAAHPDCSKVIENRLVEKGVKLRLLSSLEKIEDTPQGVEVYFEGYPEAEKADFLVMCTGVKANVGFIDQEQIKVQQGVVVNERMETNVPGIYAAGDVAQGKNLLTGRHEIIGLWANARYQGRTAGRNMAGASESYPGNIPHNITHFMGMDFVGIGDISDYTDTEKRFDGSRYVQLFWKNDLLSGANFIDINTECGIIRSEIIKKLIQNSNVGTGSLPVFQDLLIKDIYSNVLKLSC